MAHRRRHSKKSKHSIHKAVSSAKSEARKLIKTLSKIGKR